MVASLIGIAQQLSAANGVDNGPRRADVGAGSWVPDGRSKAHRLGKVGIVKMEPQPFAVSLRRVGRLSGLSVLCLFAALAPSPGRAAGPGGPGIPATTAPAASPATVEYRRKLEEYTRARQKFEDEASVYWKSIADKRRQRNAKRRANQSIVLDDYVLTQPPVYSGPPQPVDPSAPGPPPRPPREYVPVVADFLKLAAEHPGFRFNFTPQRPHTEMEYKRAYAKAALAAGLTRSQIVRIYAFESGGNGGYDEQAGLEYNSPGARAINSALGYNQLLNTNSVELLAEKGDRFIGVLKARAAGSSGEAKAALERKIEAVRRMIAFSRTVPDDWNEHDKLANTPRGFAVHALNLDIDVGPLLQTQKLVDSVHFASSKGHSALLTAAELEMMNLTGDGNGLDMVMMLAALRDKVPTSNFFQQGGYGRNPVASRNNVVAKLIAKMDREVQLQGARDMAAAF
jgi:hypothetical protein